MPYQHSYAANPNITNQAAQGVDYVAAQIEAGSAFHLDNVKNSRKELETRRSLRLAKATAVSENETSRPEIRHHAIIQEHVVSLFPEAEAPAWFGPAIRKELQVALAPITAELKNQALLHKNRKALHDIVGGAALAATVLYQVSKTVPGAGPGLPGLPPVPPPVPIPAVGAVPGPPFPATVANLRSLTAPQIHQLSAFYNDTFGIEARDTLEEQVIKFQAFITGV